MEILVLFLVLIVIAVLAPHYGADTRAEGPGRFRDIPDPRPDPDRRRSG